MWDQIEQALHQSMARVLNELASLLPGMAALIATILVSGLAAWIISSVAEYILRTVQFDRRISRRDLPSLAEWSPGNSPSRLLGRVIFWTVMLVGSLMGIDAFDATLTSPFTLQVFTYLPNAVVAALVLLAGNLIARFLSRSVLIGAVNMNLQYSRLISTGVKWMILVLAMAMALEHLAIGGSIVHIAFGILFGGIVLALALAIGLGSKELVSRSLEREVSRRPTEVEEPFRHL